MVTLRFRYNIICMGLVPTWYVYCRAAFLQRSHARTHKHAHIDIFLHTYILHSMPIKYQPIYSTFNTFMKYAICVIINSYFISNSWNQARFFATIVVTCCDWVRRCQKHLKLFANSFVRAYTSTQPWSYARAQIQAHHAQLVWCSKIARPTSDIHTRLKSQISGCIQQSE